MMQLNGCEQRKIRNVPLGSSYNQDFLGKIQKNSMSFSSNWYIRGNNLSDMSLSL